MVAIEKTYSIYCATNTINGKRYVGYTSDFKTRRKKHEWQALTNPGGHFHRAIRKYGVESFEWEILFESSDQVLTLLTKEEEFIRLKNSHARDGHGYNYSYGGNGSGFYMTDDQRRRAVETRRRNGINPVTCGMTEAARLRNTGCKQSESHKRNKAASKMRKVEIEGVTYQSGVHAAEALGMSRGVISGMIRKGKAIKHDKY